MPEHIALVVEHIQQEQSQGQLQTKLCSSCSTPVDPSALVFLPQADAIVCTSCREILSARSPLIATDSRPIWLVFDNTIPLRQPSHEVGSLQPTRHTQDGLPFDTSISAPPPLSDSNSSYRGALIPPPTYSTRPNSLTIQCTNITPPTIPHRETTHYSTTPTSTNKAARRHTSHTSHPDPFTDITRLRMRSRGHQCLYPGASFQGTQKSGRNSYDVNVTIVDVDFASSSLCGYLRIRGLTDDWPELTTYFDAEIIGSRYGFITQNWGATEHEDLVHWSRFPAFKHVKHETKRPYLTMEDRDRGAVFMRWKERFLVPDHRVQDINGASFAGFYYVCVDFNPPAISSPTRSASQQFPLAPECDEVELFSRSTIIPKADGRRRRDSGVRRSTLPLVPLSPPVATMSGFYYHQNSEPYQQLSLCHIPERTSSSFEFR